MMKLTLSVNGERYTVEMGPETRLRWVPRDALGLHGGQVPLWSGTVRYVHGACR